MTGLATRLLIALAAMACLAGVVLGYGAHERAAGYSKAMSEVRAATQVQRENNRATAQAASTDFAAQEAEIRARATQTLPEVRNALQSPICPLHAEFPLTTADIPGLPPNVPALVLADVLVPAALIEQLRRDGADPAGH